MCGEIPGPPERQAASAFEGILPCVDAAMLLQMVQHGKGGAAVLALVLAPVRVLELVPLEVGRRGEPGPAVFALKLIGGLVNALVGLQILGPGEGLRAHVTLVGLFDLP